MTHWDEELYRVEVRDEDGVWVTWCDRHSLDTAQHCFNEAFIDFEIQAARIVHMDTGEVIDEFDLESQHS